MNTSNLNEMPPVNKVIKIIVALNRDPSYLNG